VERFLADGFALRSQLASFLDISPEELERRLPSSTDDLAALHPGAFDPDQAGRFYEDTVGTGPLLECLVKTQHRDGKPLEGAHVTLGALMPSMPMAHTIKPARATPTGNAGEYKGTLELEMSGVWTVEVSFSTPVKDKQTRNLMVNECRGTARCDATPAPVGVGAHKDHSQHGSHKH
jgi:hypothetical protein